MKSQATITSSLPGKPDIAGPRRRPKRHIQAGGRAHADVVIVGAGIVGVTAAYLLSEAGLSVALLEARRIGRQVTGRSTAKITTQHSLIYRHLIKLSVSKLRSSTPMQIALAWTKSGNGSRNSASIAPSRRKTPMFIATIHRGSGSSRLKPKLRVGLGSIRTARSAPLPFSTAGALRSRNQAQFNPAQYLIGLAKAAESAGARVFEETRVTGVEESDGWQLKAGRASIHAKNVVLATNLPIAGPMPYDERTRPRSHIAMAFRIDSSAAIDGMFIGIDEPTHSLRMGRDQHGLLLVVLGSKFGTGLEGDVAKHFRRTRSLDAAKFRSRRCCMAMGQRGLR